MKTLITGGEGFIGSHVRASLKDVEVYDIKNKQDVRSKKKFTDALKNCDQVYHLAALTSAPESIKSPRHYWTVNVGGVENLLDFNGPVIFASSAAVHNPLNPYALTKCVGEELLRGRPKTKVCRFYNVFGEGDTKSVVYHFIKNALLGKDLLVYGDGSQTRSFIYVKDLVANMTFCERYEVDELGDYELQIQELAKLIIRECKSKSKIIQCPVRHGDPHTSYCYSTLKHIEYGFKEGLRRTIKHMKTL